MYPKNPGLPLQPILCWGWDGASTINPIHWNFGILKHIFRCYTTDWSKMSVYHGNPRISFIFRGYVTHILGVENLHFSWFWGPRVYTTTQSGDPTVPKSGSPKLAAWAGTVHLCSINAETNTEQNYGWWLKSGVHQLRLVVYPIIYRVSAPCQVVQDFSHQQ